MIPQIDLLNFYILPIVCFIGLFIELISALTFYKINSRLRIHDKNIKIYHYLFLYSISNIVVLLINLLYGILNCGAYCLIETYVNIYYIKQFERFGKIFICNTFNTLNIFIEFRIALDRYEKLESFKKLNNRSLSVVSLGKRANKKNVYLKSLIFLTVSVVINTPYIFIFKLENVNETIIELKPDLKTINQHPMWLKSIAIAYFLKDSSCLIFIVVLNLVISVYLKDGISSLKLGKNSMVSESLESHETETRILVNPTRRIYRPKERKVFYMILILSILLLAGNLPEAIYRVKRTLNVLFFTKRNYLPHYLLVSNILSFVCSYFKLFVYLFFSKTFLKQFKRSFFTFSTRSRNLIYV